jgi:dipeptidyl aminopeptidase/acylaminoacyl peptidase
LDGIFANRGYAVLQMNFRGSSGFGFDFMKSGLKQWGLQMQDDITDGVHWLTDNGIADKKRICIVGASYGGYAALMGAATTPDLYRCAISFAGVSNLIDFLKFRRHFVNKKVVEQQIGSLFKDADQMRATSPQNLVDRIKIPVLLVHGSNDPIVPVGQSRDMAAALKKAGKPYQYIELEEGDHWLSSYDHRLRLFQEMEKFLAANLGTGEVNVTSNQETH